MPATTLVIAPYVLLILPPALIFANSSIGFLIFVALIALCGTAAVDLFWPVKKNPTPSVTLKSYGRELFYLAFLAISTSTVVGTLAAIAGKGSIAAQIGRAEVSSGAISTLDSIVGPWSVVGIGLLLAAYLGANCSKRELYFTLAIAVAGVVISTIYTQLTARLFLQLTFLAMFLLLLGLIKFRTIIVGMIFTLIVWPTIYGLRNQLRIENGVRVSKEVSAFDRLRFDLQFSQAKDLKVPLDISTPAGYLHEPSIIEILRFGLIPRFLDSERPLVSTGHIINIALGGSSTSSFTFGPVTTVYALQGPLFLFFYYAFMAVLVNAVWRRGIDLTPIRLMILASLIHGPFGWFSTHPDVLIGSLQNLTASIPLFLILMVLPRKGVMGPDPREVDTGDLIKKQTSG